MPSAMSSNRDLEARLRGALATCQQLLEENRILKELLVKRSISLSAESEGQISEPTLTAAASEVSSADRIRENCRSIQVDLRAEGQFARTGTPRAAIGSVARSAGGVSRPANEIDRSSWGWQDRSNGRDR